ncbi:hypothetical protein F5H01DRAFT_357657, partial [Linnemannia elongata]
MEDNSCYNVHLPFFLVLIIINGHCLLLDRIQDTLSQHEPREPKAALAAREPLDKILLGDTVACLGGNKQRDVASGHGQRHARDRSPRARRDRRPRSERGRNGAAKGCCCRCGVDGVGARDGRRTSVHDGSRVLLLEVKSNIFAVTVAITSAMLFYKKTLKVMRL